MASSQYMRIFLSWALLLTFLNIANAMYLAKVRRLPLAAMSYRRAGPMSKRALDALEGSGFGLKKRTVDMADIPLKRALDALEGSGFGLRKKKALDSLDGQGFGFDKRSTDALGALDGWTGFEKSKRSLDSLDGLGFGFDKRSNAPVDRYIQSTVDELDRLEELKQMLKDELRRRRIVAEAQSYDKL